MLDSIGEDTMTPRPDLVSLPLEEKLNIIEQLWDSLAAPERDELPVPAWHRDELEKRQTDIDRNPGLSVAWDDVKRQLFAEE